MTARATLPWLAICLGCVALGLVFQQEVVAALEVWSSSTAYGHCWLVLPIAVWLGWERRDIFGRLPPTPSLWPALLAPPLIAVWLLAYWLGIMEGRQLALLGFVEVLLLAGLGWRLWWALSPALLYLVFLVPFGAFLTPALQHFTTSFIIHGLRLLNIPFEADAFRITIPEGNFYVAEACAGLRFLIASIAFGVLYAVTMFRSPGRRAAFIAISCVLPVIANGFRGLGIVVLGHILGSAEAGAADHLIYGWIFFSTVILLLALGGLPFRQSMAPAPPPTPAKPAHAAMLAGCAAIVVLASLGPAASSAFLTRHGARLAAIVPHLTPPASCTALGAQTDGPVSTQAFVCGPQHLTVTTTVLPRGTNPARILETARLSARTGLLGEVDAQVEHIAGAGWVLMTGRDLGGIAAYAVWIDGTQAVGGLHDRLHMARDMFDAGRPPLTLSVAVAPGQAGAGDTLRRFLAAICARGGGCFPG